MSMSHSVPKLIGADFELGNFVLGLEPGQETGRAASRALLREIDGVASRRGAQLGLWTSGGGWSAGGGYYYPSSGYGGDVQDWGRKYLRSNGGCAYIDLDHLELCTPEVRSAFEHVAATMAMLRITREAQVRANARLPSDCRVEVLVNNSDGRGNSYGSHLSFLLHREAWQGLCGEKPHHQLVLASHQVSSIVYTGQGKVGSENDRPDVRFQISQRADFVERLAAPYTTYNRPIVNTRDESLCGALEDRARLHVIFFDNTLCPTASLLKVGAMQLVLAMIEEGAVDLRLLVDDPVAAAHAWSHDPDLGTRVALAGGGSSTAVELQLRFHEAAMRHHERRGFPGVPRADEILALWGDTLAKLEARDFDRLVGRLDWVLKRAIVERALTQQSALDWGSPELKYLDHLYGSLDPEQGLFWAYAAEGLVESLVSEDEIEHFVHEPPSDTRAWTRAMVLRSFEDDEIERVDWDRIRVAVDGGDGRRRLELALDDPLDAIHAEGAELLELPARLGAR